MAARLSPVEAAERETRVIELRRAGMTYDEIGKAIGVTMTTARTIYEKAFKRALDNAGADELRQIEGDRLDRLQRAAWGKAITGDLPAIHTVLRIMERRAKLFGLDAPVQVNATVEMLDPASIDAEVARLAAMLGSQKAIGGGGVN